MKKILISIFSIVFSLPVYAVCSITGGAACSMEIKTPSLQEKFIPNNLNDIQKPDAFQRDFVKPYDSKMINTDLPKKNTPENSSGYNSNCQFGVCLPGGGVNKN